MTNAGLKGGAYSVHDDRGCLTVYIPMATNSCFNKMTSRSSTVCELRVQQRIATDASPCPAGASFYNGTGTNTKFSQVTYVPVTGVEDPARPVQFSPAEALLAGNVIAAMRQSYPLPRPHP